MTVLPASAAPFPSKRKVLPFCFQKRMTSLSALRTAGFGDPVDQRGVGRAIAEDVAVLVDGGAFEVSVGVIEGFGADLVNDLVIELCHDGFLRYFTCI